MGPLRTSRLVVRQFVADDLEDFLAYQGDPVVRRFLRGEVMDEHEARAYLAEQARLEDSTLGAWHGWAVEHAASRTVIGDVGVYRSEEQPLEGDIGCQFHPAFHRHGLAAEAMRALCSGLFERLGLARLTAGCDQENVASRRLLVNLGMTELSAPALSGEKRFELRPSTSSG